MPADQSIGVQAVVSPWPERVVAAALAVVALATLGRVILGLPGAGELAIGGYLCFVLAGIAGHVWRIKTLFAVAVVLTGAVTVTVDEPSAVLRAGFDTAAYLASFLLLLGVLREAAQSSPAVRDCGEYLTSQPPGRRYLALHTGGHLLGLTLNFGVLSLLGPLIKRGVAAATARSGETHLAEIRERRQLSALLRGFAWIIAWSPTTITQALLLTLLPGVEAHRLLLLGLAMALTVLLVGWLEDRLRWRHLRRASERAGRAAPALPAPRRALRSMALICVLLIASVVLTKQALEIPTVPALMLSVPCFAFAWIVVQRISEGFGLALGHGLDRGRRIVRHGFPTSSPEVLTLSSAGFIGSLAAALIPVDQVAAVAAWAAQTPLLLLTGITAVVVLAAQLALSPIMFVVFLGSALAQAPLPGIDQTAIALALGAGWALALTGSPFTASVLILSRVTGVTGTRVSWTWNGAFTMLAAGVVVLFLAAVSN
ncbi:MAG: hypothetical protein OEU09_17400 [Rhodospirillales bacterium]|nr:hypothetical protein [Rhodospirillales bacterium]MDH3913067.1 hypothetical protein [Rhodospirillales bacterium]